MARKSKKSATRKPAAKKPARRAAKKKPIASAVPKRPPLVVRVGSAPPDIIAMDAGLGLVTTIEIAMSSREAWGDGNEDIMALRDALTQAMRLLRPVREAINELRG